ncbi:NUC173 domain-containing protein [Emericellopsis atlantica]|uniref:NUC173 domain-containing protein n=1 Tax=Emericellopsis atlantica TaxID=2614577 RepID=A0A9P8CRG2_9HYPO|nr:NUC173 domain-containing protein [Emericellopsis atlantica]KAG9256317.1 NUC173 domain-containing protein [Emericellopsis atlantica]
MATNQGPTLEEKLDKIKSPGLQSQSTNVLALQSIESTIKEQKLRPDSNTYFSAILGVLRSLIGNGENVDTKKIQPFVYLLDVVTPYAPEALLRSRFTQVFELLVPVLSIQEAEASLLRASLGCLESLLVVQDARSWELPQTSPSPRRGVTGLLTFSLDPRPKIRRRAQDAIKKVLRNPPPSPSLDHPAADLIAHWAAQHLEELVKERKGRKGDTGNDPAMIHGLQLVKTVAVASGGWPSKEIESLCEMLLGIAKTGNEYMTMAVFEIFEEIFEGMTDEVSSTKLPRLMDIISQLRPADNDTQLVPPWVAILSRGYEVSARIEPDDTFQKLPEIFAMVSRFLGSPSENIRISASECLASFMANCVPESVILDASIYDEKTIEKIAKTAESLLTVQYQAAWLQTFHVLGAMFDALRWRSAPSLLNVTKVVGEIRDSPSFRSKKEADTVLGKAIRAMGPETVLTILPLNLDTTAGGPTARAWMMPVLRDYVSNTNLSYFKNQLVPLSNQLHQVALVRAKADKGMEAKIYETLVQQVWETLPGFCDLPLDLPEAFDQSFGETLGTVLYERESLRLVVCRALKVLVESNKAIATDDEGEENLVLQHRITRQAAKDNLTILGGLGENVLPVLFNIYTETLPQSGGPILQTIDAFLSITPVAKVTSTFDGICQMLAGELQKQPAEKDKSQQQAKGKDHMPSAAQALMDLVITIAIYLPRESFGALFEIANIVINRQAEPQLQKKAYKLIPRLVESETGKAALKERSADLQQLLVSSKETVSSPARRERLAAISALLLFIPDDSLHFIPTVLEEVVMCCKENNESARERAYELLVQMGQRMIDTNGTTIDRTKIPKMGPDAPPAQASIDEYLVMMNAGLMGDSATSISACITALSRVLFAFRNELQKESIAELVSTMDIFLTHKNREIVKSCLGFVKTCVISLPVEIVMPRLSTLVPNLIVWSHEHKGHFKSKVKNILERMIRRFGFDNVNNHCPEADKKLLTNIRKTKERAKRKKDAAKQSRDGEEEDQDDSENEGNGGQFDDAYEQALYSSDSDSGSDDEDEDDNEAAAPRARKSQKGGKTYIVEDEDEPLDLLDKTALANISSVKPSKMRRPTKSKVKVDLDGKLILGGDGDDAMDVDGEAAQPENSGVGAYVAALKGKDVATRGRGGKLKFSNKRRGPDDDDEVEMDEADAVAVKNKMSPRGGGKFRGRGGPGGGGRGGRGGAGPGGRTGKGGIAAGRRGLGVEKKKGHSPGGVGKPRGRR